MSKPTLVYATILAVCAGGLWAILRAGSDLAAVTDVAGEWRIESGPIGPTPGGVEPLGGTLVLDQSGRFFQVRFAGGRVIDLKATTTPLGRLGDAPARFEMVGGPHRLALTVRRDGDRVAGEFRLTGPDAATFVAYKVPPAGGAKPAGGGGAGGGAKPKTAAVPPTPAPATRPAVGGAVADVPNE